MGLFKFIKRTAKRAVRPVIRLAPKPVARVATGLVNINSATLLKYASQGPVLGPINFAASKATPRLAPYVQAGSTIASSFVPGGNIKMAINLGGVLQSVGGIISKTNTTGNPYVQGLGQLTQLTGGIISSAQPTSRNLPSAPSARTPAMVNLGTGKGIPADVAAAAQILLNRLGVSVKSASAFVPAIKRALAAIASFARRTPAGSIVSVLIGLGLSIQAANTLVAWYATKRKYRRMNPANAKALRRAARRIKGFHRLCQHTDLIKSRGRSRSFSRCGTCRKSPCSC